MLNKQTDKYMGLAALEGDIHHIDVRGVLSEPDHISIAGAYIRCCGSH